MKNTSQTTVRVLGKVTLRSGRIVKRTGCALPRHGATGLAIRVAASPSLFSGSAFAFAFRKALA